jgi:CheY-like chemotaxis protein
MATILCIEDEVSIRKDIVEELQDAGHKALQSGNGVDGLAAICKFKPDLILCDITMPKMDGFTLLTEVRTNHPEFADLPFIFLSALADRKDVLTGMSLGADDYLTKPIDFEMMIAKVDAVLRLTGRMQEKKQQEQVKLYHMLSDQLTKTTPSRASRQAEKPTGDADSASSDNINDTGDAAAPAERSRSIDLPDMRATAAIKKEAKNAVGPKIVEEVAVKFQPIWSPKVEKVIAYHGSPYQTIAGALSGDAREKHRAQVDIMVATKIVEHLEVMAAAKQHATIILSVAPETLLGPRRGTFVNLLEARPPNERKRFLMIELTPTEAHSDDETIVEAMRAAGNLVGKVMLRAGPHDKIGIVARSHGAVSLSWRYSAAGKKSTPETIECLENFATGTIQLGMHPYVFNLDTIGLVKSAMRSGFSMIGGRAVAKELDQPGDTFVLQASRVFFG